MEVCNSPNIFQENIFGIFDGFNMVCEYIYNVIVITKSKSKDHLNALDRVLQRLAEVVLKVNAEKSLFVQIETEYLGVCVSNNGVRPLLSKV